MIKKFFICGLLLTLTSCSFLVNTVYLGFKDPFKNIVISDDTRNNYYKPFLQAPNVMLSNFVNEEDYANYVFGFYYDRITTLYIEEKTTGKVYFIDCYEDLGDIEELLNKPETELSLLSAEELPYFSSVKKYILEKSHVIKPLASNNDKGKWNFYLITGNALGPVFRNLQAKVLKLESMDALYILDTTINKEVIENEDIINNTGINYFKGNFVFDFEKYPAYTNIKS